MSKYSITILYIGAGLLIALLIFGGLMPKTIYDRMAQAIMEFEGFFEGSVSWKNKNPGNLKYRRQAGSTGADSQGHAIFETFEDGYEALIDQLQLMFSGMSSIYKPTMSLYEVFSKYAEANSKPYAEFVAARLGVSPSTTLNEIAGSATV